MSSLFAGAFRDVLSRAANPTGGVPLAQMFLAAQQSKRLQLQNEEIQRQRKRQAQFRQALNSGASLDDLARSGFAAEALPLMQDRADIASAQAQQRQRLAQADLSQAKAQRELVGAQQEIGASTANVLRTAIENLTRANEDPNTPPDAAVIREIAVLNARQRQGLVDPTLQIPSIDDVTQNPAAADQFFAQLPEITQQFESRFGGGPDETNAFREAMEITGGDEVAARELLSLRRLPSDALNALAASDPGVLRKLAPSLTPEQSVAGSRELRDRLRKPGIQVNIGDKGSVAVDEKETVKQLQVGEKFIEQAQSILSGMDPDLFRGMKRYAEIPFASVMDRVFDLPPDLAESLISYQDTVTRSRDLLTDYLRSKSGKTVSDRERAFINETVGSLEDMGPVQFRAAMTSMIQTINDNQARAAAGLKEGIDLDEIQEKIERRRKAINAAGDVKIPSVVNPKEAIDPQRARQLINKMKGL